MITVIIPTRNRPYDLVSCLWGLSYQVRDGLIEQVIVIDDHSRQPYGEIVEQCGIEHEIPITWVRNPGPPGAAAARNFGATLASGKILAFLDDDAIVASGWSKAIAHHLNQPNVNAITGQILPLDLRGIFSRARQLRYDIRRGEALRSRRPVEFSAGGNSAIYRADFESIGGFDTDFVMMHDRDLVLRMKEKNLLCYYVDDLIIYHQHHKGLLSIAGNTFASGYYRLLLERHHPSVPPFTFRSYVTSLRTLIRAAMENHIVLAPALVAAAIEAAHSVSYYFHRLTANTLVPPEGYDL